MSGIVCEPALGSARQLVPKLTRGLGGRPCQRFVSGHGTLLACRLASRHEGWC